MASVPQSLTGVPVEIGEWRLSGERWLNRVALSVIVALAAFLRLDNLSALGYANHYYTAAVQAMLESWHNFFFAAAEPGGSVSIDKPPVGLWLQTISAKIFGLSGFSVLLPQILAGILSVGLIYHLVQRKFGQAAGLVAALALAIAPVVVATDRNNTMDSTLVLTLLLAAWAFIKATETASLRYLFLGSFLVGVGFNIKMLEAFLPLPAFYALYLLGSPDRLWKKIGKLSLATVLLLVVSLSWVTIVDLTPADARPYVGGSTDNSELNLIVGYNGTQRLLGMGGRGGLLSGLLNSITNGDGRGGLQARPQAPAPNGGALQPRLDGGGAFRTPPAGGFVPPQGPTAPGGRNGIFNTGQPGLSRLLIAPLSNQMSWLLPFGIFSAILLAWRSRLHWPLTLKHQAVVLWGGWLLTGGMFFSVAGFFHEYYLTILAPALAALVGIGIAELWALHTKHKWLAMALLVLAGGVTLWFQYYTAMSFVRSLWWLPLGVVAFLVGVGFLVAAAFSKSTFVPAIGFVCLVGALMMTPGIWSALTSQNSSTNQTLPAAYNGGLASFGPPGQGGAGTRLTGLQINQSLLAYLEANTRGVKYLMAVPSSMQGADYVIATGRPVLYLGGFGGQDPVETPQSLAKLVANGELKYVFSDGQRGGFGGFGGRQSSVSSWVASNCRMVRGYDTSTQNIGAPDGTRPAQGDGSARGLGPSVSLYLCGG